MRRDAGLREVPESKALFAILRGCGILKRLPGCVDTIRHRGRDFPRAYAVGYRTSSAFGGRDCGAHLCALQDQMQRLRHAPVQDQVNHRNQMLRGHYADCGIDGNCRALQRVHRAVERYWCKMLSSRSWKGKVRWKQFHQIKTQFLLFRPKLYLPYQELQAIAVL